MMNEEQESTWVCGQLDQLLAAGSPEQRKQFVLEHPVLLALGALKIIQEQKGQDPEAAGALAYLDEARVHLWQNPGDYPLGHGPLEKVVGELRSGDIDFDEALERARGPECASQLSHTYLRAVLQGWMRELSDDLTFALRAAELAWESILAMPLPSLATDARRAGAEGFIRLAHGGLMHRPDGRVFARSFEIGEWAMKDAEDSDRMALKGAYLHQLGTLALDTYAANFGPSPDFPAEVEAWLAKSLDPMPDAATGLAQARTYLSSAVEFRDPGSECGLTLKALLEAEVYLAFAKGEVPAPRRVANLARQALEHLQPPIDGPHIERVGAFVQNFGRI